MVVVMTPVFAESEEDVMMLVDVAIPFTVEVRVFTADWRSFALMKEAVVVAV